MRFSLIFPVLDTKEMRGDSCYSQVDHFYYETRSFWLFLTFLDNSRWLTIKTFKLIKEDVKVFFQMF